MERRKSESWECQGCFGRSGGFSEGQMMFRTVRDIFCSVSSDGKADEGSLISSFSGSG